MTARRRGVALFALLLTLLTALSANADEPACSPSLAAWAAACEVDPSVVVTVDRCPPGSLVVRAASIDGRAVRVEVAPSGPHTFRAVGALGVSPLGEFEDWSKEPRALQRSLDVVAQCVQESPPRLTGDDAPAKDKTAPPAPWLFLGALAILLVTFARRVPDPRSVGLLALGYGATIGVRAMVAPRAFFHQNGQGPLWVDFAWRRLWTDYGPGYAELFGGIAHLYPGSADAAVLAANGLLAACVPPLAYLLARRVSAPPLLATVLAVALALDPILIRTARSESYFATTLALLFMAAVTLTAASARVLSARFVGAVAAAGLFVAQAAVVHPLAWAPASTLPLVAFFVRGSLGARLRATAAAGLGVGLVVATMSGSVLVTTLRALGPHWIPKALEGGRFAGRALGALDPVRTDTLAVHLAYLHGFAPVVVVVLASLAGALRLRPLATRVAAGATVGIAVVAFVASRSVLTLPTDARELSWALSWTRTLPEHASVEWVERAGIRTLYLPLHRGSGTPSPRPLESATDDPVEGAAFYYRGSLCSTPDGAPLCATFEHNHALTLVDRRVFPAIASVPWAPLAPGDIEVAVYRVRGSAAESTGGR